ncbi:hypothetical protein VNI00_008604 [Paramarasmius palmivorus]|uniref:Uncharacterized protein n=1 Tax=Paramarasmius palmivorus TaxID=297713 RepID=A0AAW0CX32_9AGAR
MSKPHCTHCGCRITSGNGRPFTPDITVTVQGDRPASIRAPRSTHRRAESNPATSTGPPASRNGGTIREDHSIQQNSVNSVSSSTASKPRIRVPSESAGTPSQSVRPGTPIPQTSKRYSSQGSVVPSFVADDSLHRKRSRREPGDSLATPRLSFRSQSTPRESCPLGRNAGATTSTPSMDSVQVGNADVPIITTQEPSDGSTTDPEPSTLNSPLLGTSWNIGDVSPDHDDDDASTFLPPVSHLYDEHIRVSPGRVQQPQLVSPGKATRMGSIHLNVPQSRGPQHNPPDMYGMHHAAASAIPQADPSPGGVYVGGADLRGMGNIGKDPIANDPGLTARSGRQRQSRRVSCVPPQPGAERTKESQPSGSPTTTRIETTVLYVPAGQILAGMYKSKKVTEYYTPYCVSALN